MARILLIEDRYICLDLARGSLARDGHDLCEATDALAGLHCAVEERPGCIVVGLDLHGLDGLEVCRRLAADEATSAVPVVIWGAAPVEHAGSLAAAAGAFAYVDRSKAPGALRGAVSRALAAGPPQRPARPGLGYGPLVRVARAAQIDPAITSPAPARFGRSGQSPKTAIPKSAAKTTCRYESDVAWEAGRATRP
jgi:CheY-like chemotaxis protein